MRACKIFARMKAASCRPAGSKTAQSVCPLHGYKFDLTSGACATDAKLKAKIFKLAAKGENYYCGGVIEMKKVQETTSRREFLKVAGGQFVGVVVEPAAEAAGSAASTPRTRRRRPRSVSALSRSTDCASIVMAHELGLFKKYGIESTISKEASWAAIRDKIDARRKPGDAYAVRHAVSHRPWDCSARR